MSKVEKLSIALPPELLAVVKSAVDGGDYASTSEVIREALRDWRDQRAELERLREMVRPALESLDRGEGIPLEDVVAEVRARYGG